MTISKNKNYAVKIIMTLMTLKLHPKFELRFDVALLGCHAKEARRGAEVFIHAIAEFVAQPKQVLGVSTTLVRTAAQQLRRLGVILLNAFVPLIVP